ncbi:hypothetical protein ACLOJK_000532 [Asimina triloba]
MAGLHDISLGCAERGRSYSEQSGDYPLAGAGRIRVLRLALPRKNLSMESVDSSGEEELAIQRLEITKNDLRNRIAKEVSRLQEQLQAERDLRAALEVGLSMSSGQFSSSRSMDSKTRAELEEIALAEADVARLKQKVAELHLQLNQQRQHHYGSLSDASDRYQHVQNLHSQHLMFDSLEVHNAYRKILQQDFDMTLAFCNHERKQRSEENSAGAEWRSNKGQPLILASGKQQLSWKPCTDSPSDSKSTEASTSISMDELSAVNSAMMPNTSSARGLTTEPGRGLTSEAGSCSIINSGGAYNASRLLQGEALSTHGTTSQSGLKLWWSIVTGLAIQDLTSMVDQSKMKHRYPDSENKE